MAVFIGKEEVRGRSNLSDTTIWRREREGTFPRRVKISLNRVAWPLAEFEKWAADPEHYRAEAILEGQAA